MKLVMSAMLVGCLIVSASAEEWQWQELPTGSSASLRGLSAAPSSTGAGAVVWATGSQGTVLLTRDLGKQWHSVGPSQYAELEFRSVHAWNERQAIVASAGTPAIVLKTDDAGKSWREVHRDAHPKAFFDGLRFIDAQRGCLFGDPIDGRFTVLTTTNGGESWQIVPSDALPATRENEAAFAASNSAMIVADPGSIWIGTGGANSDHSRIFVSHDFGKSWQVSTCPLTSNATSGIFSLALSGDKRTLMAVGGDYQPGQPSATTGALSSDRGETFRLPMQPPLGYRSSVVFAKNRYIATGPTGTDQSPDGNRWSKLSDTGFHALATLPDGGVIAVGASGRYGILPP